MRDFPRKTIVCTDFVPLIHHQRWSPFPSGEGLGDIAFGLDRRGRHPLQWVNAKCKMQSVKCKIGIYRGEVTKEGFSLFWKKARKKLLSLGFVGILRKFSTKCEHFIGFEASILPLCASTTVSIVSSKLRKSITSDWFSEMYCCWMKPFIQLSATYDSSKLQIFEPPVKMARKSFCVVL